MSNEHRRGIAKAQETLQREINTAPPAYEKLEQKPIPDFKRLSSPQGFRSARIAARSMARKKCAERRTHEASVWSMKSAEHSKGSVSSSAHMNPFGVLHHYAF